MFSKTYKKPILLISSHRGELFIDMESPLTNKYSKSNQINLNALSPKTILDGRYIIERNIFQNKNFIIYLVFDKSIDSNFIIKEFFPKSLVIRSKTTKNVVIKSNDLNLFNMAKKNFLQIFNILQKFRANPNTVKIFSTFTENNTIYCVQEIPKGLTLNKFLSNNYGELNWAKYKNLFLNFMKFLNNLHENKIIHCGLSPETILIQNNKLKIIDYSNSIYNSKSFIIPPKLYDGYTPVEQYHKDLDIGTFTDVYSLAAIIYKSLTGTKPVSSTSRILNDNLLPPKNLNYNIPKNISVSIMSALITSSKIRTQTMNDFFDDMTAQSRDYYKNQSIQNTTDKLDLHINTIEPIVKNKSKKHKQMKTRNLVFIAMLFSSSIVLFTTAIMIFFLFQKV